MEAQAPPAVVGSDTGQIELLYRCLAPRLERIVRYDVRAPDAVIEDACQFAWCRLLHHRHRVRRQTALAWLATTAVREALKLSKRGGRDLPLEVLSWGVREPLAPGPEDLVDQLDQLRAVATLPVRQRRLMWLQGFGFSYGEMAGREGCTKRTVERQVLRAKRAIRRTCATGTE
jgi:DNA-directed RNA polymerase specialized sigma24 family protein